MGCMTVRIPKIEVGQVKEGEQLTWRYVVKQAIEHNPDLMAARFGIKSSARSRDIALGGYLPSVTGNLERARARTTSTLMKDNLSWDVSAEEPLFTGFDTTGKLLQAKKTLAASKWAYQETSASVRFQLRSVYVELLRLEKLLDVDRRIEERRKQNAKLVRLRYDAGREHLGSAMRAEAIASQASYEVRQTLRRTESQSILIGREMGGEVTLLVQVEGNLEQMIPKIVDSKLDYLMLAEATPKVHQLIKTAESHKAAVVSAQSVVWPQATSSADYGYSGVHASNLKDQLALALRVSMPFFNGGKNVAAIRKAKADYQAAVETARSARDGAISDLADAHAQLVDTSELVEVRKKFLDAARKRSEIVRTEYTTGLVNFQDFDIAEQDLADSEKAYVESLANVLTQEADWEFIKGSTLEDVLHEI